MKRKKKPSLVVPAGAIAGIVLIGGFILMSLPKAEKPFSEPAAMVPETAPIKAVTKTPAPPKPKSEPVVAKEEPKGPDYDAMLAEAALEGDLKAVDSLLEQGANINAADRSGQTVLHKVAASGDKKVIRHLIKKGADVNAADKKGETPLIAVLDADGENVYSTARILVKQGAAVDVADKRGRTPIAMAEKTDNKRLIKLLSK